MLVPVEGESFASWLSRAAADWQLAPGEAALALGLECRPGVVVRPLLFGVALSGRSLRRAGAATGLGARDLRAMQLARYAGTALNLAGLDRSVSEPSLAVLGHQEWALFTASRACPKCLAERPVWPLWWSLGIAAVCPVHHVLLADVCRRCRTRLGQGYNGHPRGLSSRRPEMDLSRCNNRRPAGRRRKAGLCDQKLAALPARPVSAALAALQQRVLDIADGRAVPRVAGRTVAAAEFFAALRFTTVVARLVATDDDLAACSFLPDEAAEAFTAEQHARQRATQGGARTQMGAVPPAAAHAAAVLALAEPVLLGPGQRSGSDLLSEWIGRAVARRRTPGKGDPLRTVPRPACLEPLVRAAVPPATRVAGALAARPVPVVAFTADHLPHLVDADDYTDLLAPHLPGTAPASGRRLAAMCLARLAGAPSWQQAAGDLAMDPLKAARAANTLVQRITDPDAFWDSAERLARRYHRRGLVDYGARRRALATLTAVPHAVLYQVCRPLDHDVTLQRRRHAAAWVWQHFTGGDVREAPAYDPRLWPSASTESVREGWRRFAAWIPDTVATHLTAHGHGLLHPDTPGGT
ncbi:TniQ family protein [Streptomyces anulatus]|uniref:TniQ family protein n=1 Tax=Streptomyces anulatus TaxID=1892 RepID=UPI00386E2B69|nr:TniQ family protein [Streptomyces anulatus]